MATPEEVNFEKTLAERGVRKGIRAYDTASRVFYPAFMGGYTKNLAGDMADALNVSGIPANRNKWEKWGAGVGAVTGAASLTPVTKLATVADPLMMSGLYKDLSDRYGVTAHLGTLTEAVDPLNINKDAKFNNTSLWDRILGWAAEPMFQADATKAVRDIARFSPAVPAWLKNDYTEQVYNDFMSKVISQNSYKNRPYFGNRVAPLEATKEYVADRPYEGWVKDFVSGFNPQTWPEAYKSLWKTLTGD